MASDLGVLAEMVVAFWRRRWWWVVPLVGVLCAVFLVLRCLAWLPSLWRIPAVLRSRAREADRKRSIEAEGRQIYPLW